VGFVRKAAIISTGGLARAGGLKGKSKKERDAQANEKLAKIEDKRFKAQQKAAKAEHRAAMAETAKAQTTVLPDSTPTPIQAPPVAAATPTKAAQGPPPGWYLDPDDGSLQRWWDGTGWTEVKQATSPEPNPPPTAP
jgi:hypothetical protein